MSFFKKNSYEIIRLFVIQVGMMIFSMTVMMAATRATDSVVAKVAVSLFSAGFYLFIVYSTMWHVGYKRGERMIGGRLDDDARHGAKVALFASLPNLFFCLLMAIGLLQFVGDVPFFANLYAVARLIHGFLLNSVYAGLIGVVDVDNVALKEVITTVLSIVSVLPLVITSQIACRFGEKNIRLTKDKPKVD